MVALVLDGLVGFAAGLSPTSFHLSPTSFHCLPGWVLVAFVSQAGCLWSGSRLACLPLPFICLPLLFFSFVSHFFSLSPRLGACGICLPGWVLVVGFPGGLSPFLSFVSHFFSGWMVWSGSRLACLPLPFICLPLLFICLPLLFSIVSQFFWVLVVGFRFPAGLSPTSFHLFPTSFHLSPTSRLACLPLLVRFPAGLSPTSFHLSPTSFHLSPTSFHLSPRLDAFPASLSSLHLPPTFPPSSLLLGVLNSFLRCVRPLCHCWCPPIDTGHAAFLFICLPCLSLLVSGISIHLPGLLLVVSALGRWPCGVSIHLSPRSATGVARPFPLATQHPHSFVSQVCHCWCPPFSAGDATFLFVCLPGLFICLPGLSLLVSALFRWPCSISVHLSHRLVTGGVRPFLLFLFICLPGLSHVSPRPVTGDVRPFPLAM